MLKEGSLKSQIQNWKLKQNMVLTVFLHAFFQLPAEEREKLPIKVKLGHEDGERNHLINKEGEEVCEYTMIDSMPFAHWYRTLDDYLLIDRIGKKYGSNTETT